MYRLNPIIDDIVELKKEELFPLSVTSQKLKSFYMRFELGGEGNKDSKLRVLQATNRATTIYEYLVGNRDILISMKEWPVDTCIIDKEDNNYIFNFIDRDKLEKIKGPFSQVYYKESENGELIRNIFHEPLECDLLLGRINLSALQVKSIINGIVSFGMGGINSIAQDVTFHLVSEGVGLRVYDDRGCDVWSKSLDSLYPLYIKMNEWILDYNRAEINKMFKNYK